MFTLSWISTSVNYNKIISSNTNNSLTRHVINNIFLNVLRLKKIIVQVNFSYENSIILVFTEITETNEWHSADAKGSCDVPHLRSLAIEKLRSRTLKVITIAAI